MKKYVIDDMTLITRRLVVNENTLGYILGKIYLASQCLIVIHALSLTAGMPIQLLVIAVSLMWFVGITQKL